MKIQKTYKADGFTLFDCGIGACPEIKQVGDEYFVRNSRNPESEVTFTKEELEILKSAIEQFI